MSEKNIVFLRFEEKRAMTVKSFKFGKSISVVAIFFACLTGVQISSFAQGLTNRESDGYLQWMHSLEVVMENREETGLDEGNLLYPFDVPGWIGDESRPYRHLSISKAINELEAEWLLRGESRTQSTLVALANARNYVNLSEFDSATVWFNKAAELDTANNFLREISIERLATAAADRDSLAMLAAITNSIGNSTIIGQEGEFILALRWLLIHQDKETLDLVLQKIIVDGSTLTDRLRFWVAYSMAWRKDISGSLEHLKILINSGGLSRDLTEKQRAWVLFAIPDFLFLADDYESSRTLYDVLENSKSPKLATWGRYQIANLDFLNGLYLRASEGFKRICDGKRQGSWQDHACEMAKVATEIERIKSEGEPYGAGSFYTP